MSSLDNSLKVGSNEMELVDFRIHKQVGEKSYEGIYGVNVSKVKEIIRSDVLLNGGMIVEAQDVIEL